MDLAQDDDRVPPSGRQPPHARPVDPDQVRTGWSRTWLGIALVSLVLSLLALVVVGMDALFADARPSFDTATTATVTRVNEEHYASPKYDPCSLEYEFSVGGTTYSAASPDSSEGYCALGVGDPIDITYDSADPSTNIPTAAHSGPTTRWFAATAAWLLFVFSIVSLVVAWRRKR